MELESGPGDLGPTPPKRTTLEEIEGVLFPSILCKHWSTIQGFKARPDDLLICTYPKAGTTWIQQIVSMVQHKGDLEKCNQKPIYERMPFIEMPPIKPFLSGVEQAELMPSPRILKSHLPVQLLPPSFWEQKCKVIYVARNAKDNVVSYFHFHHMSKIMAETGTWNEFLENFIAGKVAWGSWSDHVRGWWEAKDCHPVLYLFYEDMKEDPAREIRKVVQFMGLELPESVLNQIVQHTKFESMKANPMANYSTMPSFLMDHTVSPFMRKGTVGNWKKHFTVAQSEWLDDACAQLLKGSGLNFRTEL
ncbi:sulfotransferase 1C2 isoform X1 [Zootoca vivipara]|uniref:sulfotransferase 1C2 isoform X1 n=1 Tax=Zootoca vivipara TaxID=8524 RepID=UPI001590AB97|nr:sulfotransferase 1C2 isoform X1 [Zootoca vivipara]XP_034991682.1 sulfotransferase 1C2 isoform X1 [Zootoca vivipara]